jgi:hypothetical protein
MAVGEGEGFFTVHKGYMRSRRAIKSASKTKARSAERMCACQLEGLSVLAYVSGAGARKKKEMGLPTARSIRAWSPTVLLRSLSLAWIP